MKLIRTLAITASASAMAVATPASAATIVLSGLNSISSQQAREGFQTAANFWGSQLTDNVTINIAVGFSQLGPGVLGSTSSNMGFYYASGVIGTMAGDITSSLDVQAVTSLIPAYGSQITFEKAGYTDPANHLGIDTTTSILDADGSIDNIAVGATTASLKAMGIDPGNSQDASVAFSSDYAFDFDPRDGITAGTLDFVGVAIHEFEHALGFTSSVDVFDVYGCPGGPACELGKAIDFNDGYAGTTLDLFRYSQAGLRQWTPGKDAYFSVDGGVTQLYGNAAMSTGQFNGDGWQASHWQASGTCSNYVGIMNPYLCGGQNAVVTAQDMGALDAIGWDLTAGTRDNAGFSMSTAQIFNAYGVPEPATWIQLILGFGLIGGLYRSVKQRSKAPALI